MFRWFRNKAESMALSRQIKKLRKNPSGEFEVLHKFTGPFANAREEKLIHLYSDRLEVVRGSFAHCNWCGRIFSRHDEYLRLYPEYVEESRLSRVVRFLKRQPKTKDGYSFCNADCLCNKLENVRMWDTHL